MSADLIERLRHFSKLLGGRDLPEIMSEAADALAAKDTALSEMRAELAAAKHELSCCDDIPLDQGLVVGISSLQADREYLRAELERARKALEAGRQLANAAYNIGQQGVLTQGALESLVSAQMAWDEALTGTPASEMAKSFALRGRSL